MPRTAKRGRLETVRTAYSEKSAAGAAGGLATRFTVADGCLSSYDHVWRTADTLQFHSARIGAGGTSVYIRKQYSVQFRGDAAAGLILCATGAC